MSGYEEQLHARAEMLDETGELAAAVTAILAGASGAGVDPRAIASLRAAIPALDPAGGPPGYQAGSRTGRHPGSGYGSDGEFLEAVSDAEDQIRDWLRDAEQLQEQVIAALDKAHADLERAQRDLQAARQALAAAYAMPTKKDCDGCHGRKAAAITAAEAAIAGAEERIRDATRRIGICEDTAEILDPLPAGSTPPCRRSARYRTTSARSTSWSTQFIRRGGKMPRLGRWIEGARSEHRPGAPDLAVPGLAARPSGCRNARWSGGAVCGPPGHVASTAAAHDASLLPSDTSP